MPKRGFRMKRHDQREKLERLYHGYRDQMYQAAFRILGDSHEAEDAVHLAFEKAAEHLDKINENDCHKTGGFLVIIVKRISLDILRRKKREAELPDTQHSPEAGSFEVRDAIVRAIKSLPEQYREVLLLKYSHGYDNGEIGSLLGIREDNVRQRISRGKKLLAEMLREEGIEV